jgi:hypothetical protein
VDASAELGSLGAPESVDTSRRGAGFDGPGLVDTSLRWPIVAATCSVGSLGHAKGVRPHRMAMSLNGSSNSFELARTGQ